MSSRREIFLEEMGLTPIWRLRDGAAVAETEAEAEATQALPEAAVHAAPAMNEAASAGAETAERAAKIGDMAWEELKATVTACTACGLRKTCTQTVFGIGDETADWLLVGEAPGADEDARGEPFVGQAGKLLDNMLAAIGLRRGEDVYIANAVKCRPPENRTPTPEETAICRPYLERQIELVRPRLIVALGRPAAQTLLQEDVKIGAARGKLHDYRGIPLIVSYHPAYLLRTPQDKARAWEDLCFMRRTMRTQKDL